LFGDFNILRKIVCDSCHIDIIKDPVVLIVERVESIKEFDLCENCANKMLSKLSLGRTQVIPRPQAGKHEVG